MTPLIIENVIPKGYQNALESDITRSTFSWLYVQDATYREYGTNSGFVHAAFDFGKQPSDYLPFIKPLVYSIEESSGIPISQLLRIRIGFLLPSPVIPTRGYNAPHVDFHQPHYTACYYINDSDGDTRVFEQTLDDVGVDITEDSLYNYSCNTEFTEIAKCTPKKGTVFVFNGKNFHSSTNPVHTGRRLVVTVNWV